MKRAGATGGDIRPARLGRHVVLTLSEVSENENRVKIKLSSLRFSRDLNQPAAFPFAADLAPTV